MKKRDTGGIKKSVRRGTPFTIYFSAEQTESLNDVAKQRHVSKATLVRLAVDHLMRQLESGQLRLPLGIQERSSNG